MKIEDFIKEANEFLHNHLFDNTVREISETVESYNLILDQVCDILNLYIDTQDKSIGFFKEGVYAYIDKSDYPINRIALKPQDYDGIGFIISKLPELNVNNRLLFMAIDQAIKKAPYIFAYKYAKTRFNTSIKFHLDKFFQASNTDLAEEIDENQYQDALDYVFEKIIGSGEYNTQITSNRNFFDWKESVESICYFFDGDSLFDYLLDKNVIFSYSREGDVPIYKKWLFFRSFLGLLRVNKHLSSLRKFEEDDSPFSYTMDNSELIEKRTNYDGENERYELDAFTSLIEGLFRYFDYNELTLHDLNNLIKTINPSDILCYMNYISWLNKEEKDQLYQESSHFSIPYLLKDKELLNKIFRDDVIRVYLSSKEMLTYDRPMLNFKESFKEFGNVNMSVLLICR